MNGLNDCLNYFIDGRLLEIMGDFTEHVLFGFLAAAVVSYFAKDFLALQPAETLAASIAIVIGSVLPDIDHKNSYIHRATKAFLSIGTAVVGIVFLPFRLDIRFSISAGLFLLVYVAISHMKMQHRGFTHSISFCSGVSAIATMLSLQMFYSPVPGLAAAVGLFSHLLLDREFKMG